MSNKNPKMKGVSKNISKILNTKKKKTPKQSAIDQGKEVIKDLEARGFF